MSGIVIDDRCAPVVYDAVVLIAEMLSGSSCDERFHLSNHDIFYRGIHDERAGGNAGSEAHDEHPARPRMNERRNMSDHALQAHVGWCAGCLRFAADGEHLVAALASDEQRRVDSLAAKQNLWTW